MSTRQHITIIKKVVGILKASILTLSLLMIIVVSFGYQHLNSQRKELAAVKTMTKPEVLDGIHIQTGLVDGPGLSVVIENCTACHSAKLITQNRMTKQGWKSTIQWMQETQNLWELGKNEDKIIEYLAANYAPEKKGRRAQLSNIEWYELE